MVRDIERVSHLAKYLIKNALMIVVFFIAYFASGPLSALVGDGWRGRAWLFLLAPLSSMLLYLFFWPEIQSPTESRNKKPGKWSVLAAFLVFAVFSVLMVFVFDFE